MKKYLIALAFVALLVGCTGQNYDDSVLLDKIASLDKRVQTLEGNMVAVQTTLEGKTVQKVEENKNGDGITVGVTVTYTDGSVYRFEVSTANTAAGPALCIVKNGAGELCWALDYGGTTGKVILKDAEGNEVRIYMSPEFEIGEDGHLYMTLEGIKTDLGKAVASGGGVQDGMIKAIDVTAEAVVITYDTGGDEDGTINIPLTPFKLVIEQTAIKVTSTDPITIPYTITNKTEQTIVDAYYNEDKFDVAIDAAKIVVTPKAADAAGMILVFADSKTGLTSIVKLVLGPTISEPVVWEMQDTPSAEATAAEVDYLVPTAGGTVNIHVLTNIEFEVKPVTETWVHVGDPTKAAVLYTIPVTIDANATPNPRTVSIVLYRKGTTETVQTIVIGQEEAILPPGPIPGNPDLSAGGVANCYIVYEAGEYKFKTVKGNSEESVGAVASVEVVWETVNTADAVTAGDVIASVAYADNYITFTTADPVKPGNALIAAKDGEGAILWSWHIWIPASSIGIVLDANLISGKIMDRNLGALVAPTATVAPMESYGLNYQWGRKDPLVAQNYGVTVPSTKVAAAAEIDIAYSILHPTEYIKGSENENLGNWNNTDMSTLWNDGGNKTIYDPCPAGYRVPVKGDGEKMWTSGTEGWTAGTGTLLFGEIAFPYSGYFENSGDGTGLYHLGDRAMIWSATWASADKAKVCYLRDNKMYTSEYYKYVGANIRCVKQ